MTGDKVFNLLKKLKALADRGVGGEKDNADAKLKELCLKYDVSLFDIEENESPVDHEIWLKDDQYCRKLFLQVASTVVGNNVDFGTYVYKHVRKPGFKRHRFTCKSDQFIEVMAKYDFYQLSFNNDIDLFFSAFVQKNKLYPNVGNPIEVEWSDEEIARQFKIAQMAEGLDRKHFRKQIDK